MLRIQAGKGRFLNWFVPGRSRYLPAAPHMRISVLRTNYRRFLQKLVYIQN